MDKNAIKSFAIESRRQMIESVKYQASLIGITSEGISEPISKAEGMETYDYGAGTYSIYDEDIQKRESLVWEVNNKGFDNVVEEVAYTWFNRIIAIRFMEVNDYLPTRTRVLSSEIDGKIEPDMITDALDLDFDYNNEDKELILKLKDENKLNELFVFLFIKQCNKLNEILPGLFERTDDYMELLLNISFTDDEGIIRKLINSISEESFGEQVEIIGWLYQFYNTELKDETFANTKKKIKINKDRIPSATQLFTPRWIVKYMVENSLGRLWLEGHPNEILKSKWKYYVDDAKQEMDVDFTVRNIKNESKNLQLTDIKIIDPCMGSGHILVYVFEVLMDIYVSEGFTEKDACESILKNNIYGLDIDKRAYQLAYFSILMKARKYNRNILNSDINPLLYSIEESNALSTDFINYISSKDFEIKNDLEYICDIFEDSKEYGSALTVKKLDFNRLINLITTLITQNGDFNKFIYFDELSLLANLINQAKLLCQSYDVVITNPPYMGSRNMDSKLINFLKENYKDTKKDLCTVFMDRSFMFAKEYGFIAMINPPAWMFISSYEKLREKIIKSKLFINMLHLGRGIFGPDFGTTSFVLRNCHIDNYKSTFKQVYYNKSSVDSILKKEKMFFENKRSYISDAKQFLDISGFPIAYWVSDDIIEVFKNNMALKNYADLKQGLATGNNKKYLRYWFEVNIHDINFTAISKDEFSKSNSKYCPYKKGGSYKRWYGNQDYIIRFDDNAYNELLNAGNHLPSRNYYFNESLSWSTLSMSNSSFRYYPKGFVFDSKGSSLFFNEDYKEYNYYILGFLNSKVSQFMLDIITPTLDYSVGYISLLPFIINDNYLNEVTEIVLENISLSKIDWDSFEVSWDFKKSPLLNESNENSLREIYSDYINNKQNNFNILKSNEIKLNNLFNEIYNVNIENNVDDSYVSMSISNYEKDMKLFISYAVGCMVGRYSLDDEGLQFAGGNFDLSNYYKFVPDDDNIIPILDTEYFDDDIMGRFIEFVKVCFGEELLEDNLNFIAGALNKKGKTSREIIRNYFISDFFKDHSKMYNKCPIYWQFDSGKQNAFKCLIYMHRYDSSIIARVRTDYLHKTQKAIEQNMSHCDSIIANSTNKSEVSSATKDKSKYIKQLDEIKLYDEALRHMATQNIEIDLDEGVKENYKKFQKIEISFEGEKPKKINLLKNI
nr:BREX-1 system adenine-specific DNA-methyltransferase PglX [Methanobrevibacter smithii]